MTGHTYRIPIRWVDLDAQGHVNNATIVDYLQEARVSFLLEGPNAHLLGNGIIVVGHHVEYLRPVELDSEPATVNLSIGHVGGSRFVIGYDMVQHDQLCARARTTACLFDFDAGSPRRMSPEERAHFKNLSTHLEPLRSVGHWQVGENSHRYEFRVRWSDLDSYGHVNNIHFYDYVAEARIQMTTESDIAARRAGGVHQADHLWLVARQDMDYVGQIEHRLEPYVVRTAVAKLGTTSMTLAAQIEDPLDGRLLGRSTTVLVCADLDGRPTAIPEAVAAGVTRWPAVPRH